MTWESALAAGNSVRFARAAIRKELRACSRKETALEMTVQHVEDPVAELATLSLISLVAYGYRCGDTAGLQVVEQARVSANVCVGQPGEVHPGWLTDTQRVRVCEALRELADDVRYNRRQRMARARPKPVLAVVPAPEPEPQPEPEPEPPPTPEPVEQGPSLSKWCSKCAEWALPMRDGTCGFCDTRIEAAA